MSGMEGVGVGVVEIAKVLIPELTPKVWDKIMVPKEMETLNKQMEGKKVWGTNVQYIRDEFRVGTHKVEGVFPVFESKFTTRLSRDMWVASDIEQAKYCTEKLAEYIKQNPACKEQFTGRQLKYIMEGEPYIPGLTWHHHQRPGRMQLVKASDHMTCKHTGGRQIWGGGLG